MARYTVWALDVWENDGFFVNDRRRVGTIEILSDMSDDEILGALEEMGLVRASKCTVSDHGIEVFDVDSRADGRPLLTLVLDETEATS